jgi:MinD-like ATPase involved in chromosome partitioning or flagellar assembly
MADQPDTGTIITLFSAQTGVGKTTIAINLAVALAQETGNRPVLADLDVRFGDVCLLLDIPVERSIADLALPEQDITGELVEACLYTHATGLSILPAPIRPTDWRQIEARHVERIVGLLAERHDLVILDTPDTFNDIVVSALRMATDVALISTADEKALENTRQAIGYLRSVSLLDKTKLVINATNEVTHMKLRDIGRTLNLGVFSSLPYDRNIRGATQVGTALVVSHPDSTGAQSIRTLAEALIFPRAVQASKAPAAVRQRRRGQTARRDQSRKVEKTILHTAKGYAESRRAGIGVADDGRVWIQFIDYPPEETCKCSLCGKSIGFGWRDLRNTQFICEGHIEFSDKTVFSAEVERIRQSEAALASLATGAAAAPAKAAPTKIECATCGRELTAEDLEFNDLADDDDLEFYEGLLSCKRCEEAQEDASTREEELTSAADMAPAPPPQSISEEAVTIVGVLVATVATIVFTILGFLWIWSVAGPGAAILAAIFLWTIPATVGYWVGVAVIAPFAIAIGLIQKGQSPKQEIK